jgi:hypothetical protein
MRSEGLLGKALLEERDAYEIRYKRDQVHAPEGWNVLSCVSVDDTYIGPWPSGAMNER